MDDENEVIDDNQQVEDAPELDETPAPEGEETTTAEDEITVQIGDEQPAEEERAPDWVRDLRKQHRELQRKNRELEEQIRTARPSVSVQLGKKPTLEDHNYDSDSYEAALSEYFERKRQVDAEAEKIEAKQRQTQQDWQEKLNSYGKAKAELKVSDFDDAESAVQEQFNVTQQGILLQGLDTPAMVVYALGKNPKRAKELAAITDPVKFAVAIGKLEEKLKVIRKAPPPPPKPVTGTGRVSGSVDSTLERLRAEAEKTGDISKVLAYKRQKRA